MCRLNASKLFMDHRYGEHITIFHEYNLNSERAILLVKRNL